MATNWWLQRRITPGLQYSQDVFEGVLRDHVARARRWLDLGCGHRVLSEWREAAEADLLATGAQVIGIDYDLDSLRKHRSIRDRIRGNISSLPFPDASFDLVTANMVVEHLDDPEAQFREVARVLEPGGVFLFHTPNERSYVIRMAKLLPDEVKQRLAKLLDGRDESDVFPTHYRANRPDRIAHVATRAGFDVGSVSMIRSSPTFSVLPPLLVPELLWLRALGRDDLAHLRTNIVCALVRQAGTAASAPRAKERQASAR